MTLYTQTKRKSFFLLLVLFCPLLLFGQNKISFAYDAAGNRVKREIVLPPVKAKSNLQRKSQAIKEYSDIVTDHPIRIISNPEISTFTIQVSGLSESDVCNIAAYSSTGLCVFVKERCTESTIVSLQNHPAGVYIIQITVNNQTTVWKISKR